MGRLSEADRQTAEVPRLTLDLIRILSTGLLGQARFAAHADSVLLLAGVVIGQAEGRPMTAGKMAQYAGLGRPTAIRRLNQFHAAGIVTTLDGGTNVMTGSHMEAQPAGRAIAAVVALLQSFARMQYA